ncbi:MAG: ABC transporter ATP-binding protein [Acidimicrobiaceae bacterium]|nr:ABC transporter ATP-binding protein [Acidimicrobiaceae bacterium]
MAPLLEVDRLVKAYGGVHAVDGVSFAVPEHSITGLIGPNGAGKSTVLAAICGFTRPTAGHIRFAGEDVTGHDMHQLARRGLVRTFQLARVFGNLTAIENVMVGLPRHRGESPFGLLLGRRYWAADEKRALEHARMLFIEFGLEGKEDEYGRNLSGGQRRAVEIMRALLAHPRMLLLDEPMAGLSPTLSRQLEEHLLQLQERGLTLLLVEHELDTVDRLCSNVLMMAHGRLLAEGPMEELRNRREVQDAYVVG